MVGGEQLGAKGNTDRAATKDTWKSTGDQTGGMAVTLPPQEPRLLYLIKTHGGWKRLR